MGWGGTQTALIVVCPGIYSLFFFSMSDEEALGGAGDTQVIAVDDRIQGLEHQVARLTQMIQNGVKLETHGMEKRELVKAAL